MIRRKGWALAGAAGVALAASLALAGQAPDERRSGFAFMSRETQAMQTDDAANPGMLWALEGERLWAQKAGKADLACADCHGEAKASMKGVAARHPAWSEARGRPVNLDGRINLCREHRQDAPALAPESRELLALAAYVGLQSRGMPISPPDDARLAPFRATGEALFHRPIGQLDFACADCHDANADRRLAGAPITQAHPTGYPLYRLEWQDLGSLQRRLRNCMVGVRAEPYPAGSDAYVDLELYLMGRARGMPMETPAVRP